jgi:hypothetical protein
VPKVKVVRESTSGFTIIGTAEASERLDSRFKLQNAK